MKVLLTIWISAVLIQEVVPSTLVRYPRHANNASSFLHTEYEAKIEQKGKHGNESFGTMSGKQAIEHDNCNDNWNAFANKCAALIKDLVASLANSVSSKPGDATNLQLHIKNTFRHLDNTHNCSCLNHTGKGLSDIDLSHIFDNLTLSTTSPAGDDDEGNLDDYNEEPSSIHKVEKYPKKLTSGTNVDPENEEDPNSTSNSRRQAKHEPYSSGTPKPNDITDAPSVAQKPPGRKGTLHPFLTTPLPSPERSYSASDATPSIPPLYYSNKHLPPESSSSKKSPSPYASDNSLGNSHRPESDSVSGEPTQTEQTEPLIVTSGKRQKPMKKVKDSAIAAQTPIPKESDSSQSAPPEHFTPKPDYDYDELTPGSAKPKPNDHSSSVTDPYSYEIPDYDSSTETPKPPVSTPVKGSKDKQPIMIPVTNTASNVPESSEPTTSHDSLSSIMSSTPFDENSYTENPLSSSVGSTPDSEQTTPAFEETSDAETVTVSPTLSSESPSTDEAEDEVLITPRPKTGSYTPAAEDQKLTEKLLEESEATDSTTDSESLLTESSSSALPTEEGFSTTPQSVYPTDEQAMSSTPASSDEPYAYGTTVVTTEKDDEEIQPSTLTDDPTMSSQTYDHDLEEDEQQEHTTTVTLSTPSPVEEGTTENEEENEDHTEVSENPVLVQPTTFQTTSEEPTPSPISTRPSTDLVSVTSASTPQDSDEGTTSESKHEKHHGHHHDDDDEDDEDDCCSCESCTEEEESDSKKVKENVCKSLEEARKELKAIFDKIKKKLRCCRKMPRTITTNTSPLPQ